MNIISTRNNVYHVNWQIFNQVDCPVFFVLVVNLNVIFARFIHRRHYDPYTIRKPIAQLPHTSHTDYIYQVRCHTDDVFHSRRGDIRLSSASPRPPCDGTLSASIWPLPRQTPGLAHPCLSERTPPDETRKHASAFRHGPASLRWYYYTSQHSVTAYRPYITLTSFGGIPQNARFLEKTSWWFESNAFRRST